MPIPVGTSGAWDVGLGDRICLMPLDTLRDLCGEGGVTWYIRLRTLCHAFPGLLRWASVFISSVACTN